VRDSCFYAGLEKIKTPSPAYRPDSFIGFPELQLIRRPDFVVDISEYWHNKMKAIRFYKSQVISPGENDEGTKTFIRSQDFWEVLEARARMAGALIGAKYGEPFYSENPPRIDDPIQAFRRKKE
jgi:LmbE family N-acetylglucosaminyl deacetylase